MRVVNVKKKSLQQMGYDDFEHWKQNPNNVYIGRNMSMYVPGATESKWKNPFSIKKYSREEVIKRYRKYIESSPLMSELEELEGKTLGCWCAPESCHGDILIELLNR